MDRPWLAVEYEVQWCGDGDDEEREEPPGWKVDLDQRVVATNDSEAEHRSDRERGGECPDARLRPGPDRRHGAAAERVVQGGAGRVGIVRVGAVAKGAAGKRLLVDGKARGHRIGADGVIERLGGRSAAVDLQAAAEGAHGDDGHGRED